ncbi:LOW QUALITY PROTEIN: hypothetical protein CRUP_020168, partial [Coryphaenoides rupestris]
WDIEGAGYGTQCGEIESGSALVFDQDGRRRTPGVVSVALPTELQTPVTQFCLEQRIHGGQHRHAWALDFMQLLPVLPGTHTHIAQFSINLGCGSYQPGNSVSLEFSTNHGRSWSLLHTECLPELCAGPHLPHSTVYSSDNYSGYLQFTLRLGSRSTMSSCPAPDQPGEGVLLHFSSDNGITWTLLQHYAYHGFHEPRFPLPYHSGRAVDVWALDEISMTSVLFNTISLDFSNVLDVTQSLGFYLGHVQPYCQHDWTLSFSGEPSPGSSLRYVETQSMQIGASYSLQFSLVMGCGREPSPHIDTQVRLEFSTNHGLTWHLVKEACLPGMPSCSEFTAPSVYHPSEFRDWRRITLPLPQKTWSSATRFRWIQNYYGEQDEWALDDIYIGQQCPSMCHGHGWCDHGHCRCDDGFSGADCQPFTPLSSSVLSDFESQDALLATWQEVIGGEVVNPGMGCGVVSSGSSLYFSKLVSWDLDTEWAEFVQFYLRVGGDWAECNQADSREEGVLLQYSNDGGISWGLIAEMYFTDFTKPRFVHYELPLVSKTPSTRFRWWQPLHSGDGYDQWAIDDMSVWLMLGNEGMERESNSSFCAPTPSAMVFGRSDGDRVALNIGCESDSSTTAPVLLQYSQDAGRTWALVKEGCYPGSPGAGGCEGSGRELREPSVYNTGDYEQWARVTVVVPRNVAASKTRFRWFQESSQHRDAPAFALDGVYISEPCPNHCGGHGDCISGVCFCDMGFTEGFEGKLSPLWQSLSGGQVGGGCGTISEGKALYFSSPGRREARTVPLDTTNTRLVQFYIRIGSKSLGPTCTRPRSRNEGNTREEDESAMVFVSSELGEHSITTRDVDVNENTIIQFEINVGCTADSSSNGPVRLEFSRDFGATWHLLVPLCAGGPQPSSLCSTELHPASVYYSGTTQGWRREVVHFGKLRLCGSVRFRWYQGFFSPGAAPPTWALDNVYIGPQCQDMCNGHGSCVGGTHCACDPGYSGADCSVPDSPNPDFLKEDFEGGVVDADRFRQLSGGKPSRKCGIMSSGNHLFVQFFLRLGCGKASPDPRSQPVLLQYSVDGGLTWGLLQDFLFSNSSNQARLVALEIPLRARTATTRFRWWQPSENGHFYSPWVIDQDDFSSINGRSWLLHPGGTRMPVCGSEGAAFAFIEKSNTRYAFSLDLGLNWKPLVRDCLPTSPDCSSYTLQRLLVADTYNKWGRLTMPIPSYARSPATRFRWYQQAPFDKQQTWALDNLYIGDGCPDMCSGHGRCQQSSCVCDPEWGGEYCDEPLAPLPTQLKDSFSRAPSLSHWLLVTGAKLSTVCGAVASGAALHFSGSCSRQLVTADLNLTNAEFVQFYFMYGCMIPPSNRNQGVLLEYSMNGGINWHLLTEIFYDLYTKPGFVNVLLPPAARQEGVRMRWWQPQHDGADHSDWALDNVLISGSDPRAQISDTFGGVALPNHERAPADATASGKPAQPSEQEDTP